MRLRGIGDSEAIVAFVARRKTGRTHVCTQKCHRARSHKLVPKHAASSRQDDGRPDRLISRWQKTGRDECKQVGKKQLARSQSTCSVAFCAHQNATPYLLLLTSDKSF
jgi:hypothetical protein